MESPKFWALPADVSAWTHPFVSSSPGFASQSASSGGFANDSCFFVSTGASQASFYKIGFLNWKLKINSIYSERKDAFCPSFDHTANVYCNEVINKPQKCGQLL